MLLLNAGTAKVNKLYYETKRKNKFLPEVSKEQEDETAHITLSNSLNVEDRKILNNVESIASLNLEQDSPEIRVTNIQQPKGNYDL